MLWIFDWDGTLSDSTAKIVSCMQAASRDVGLVPQDYESVKDIIGLGLPEAINRLYPGADNALRSKLQSRYSEYFVSSDSGSPPLFPEVMDTLETFKQEGHILTVATGKSRRGLNRALRELGLSKFFDASRCADETQSKPNPQMLFELVEQFDWEVGDAIMVGDTEFDMEMAQRCGMHRVAVSYGAHHVGRLVHYNPMMCIDHFSQLKECALMTA